MPTFTVTAHQRSYQQCPMNVTLQHDAFPAGHVELVDQHGMVCPAQAESAARGTRLWWVLPAIARGQSLTYTVRHAQGAKPSGVTLARARDTIDVQIDGQPFTTCHFGGQWSKPFLHPLLGPTGSMTRRYPMEEVEGEHQDHPHHKGCWVAWGEVNGSDIWSEADGHGAVVANRVAEQTDGPVMGTIRLENTWQNAEGTPLLSEQRMYRFYNLPTACRAFDMKVTLTPVDGPVKLGDTKEGGICSVRVATSMDASDAGTFTNAYGGIKEDEGWGKRAPWCDYCGPVGNQTVGICIMDHPTNYRYPTWWHVRNYGLMTANPFGLSYFEPDAGRDGSITLETGQSMTFQYRVFTHTGNTHQANIASAYHHYINPPSVTISE